MRVNRLPKITKIITKMEFLRITQPSHEKTFDNSRTSSTVPNRIKSSTLCCIIPTSATCDTSPLHICGTTLLLFVAVGSRNCAEKISSSLLPQTTLCREIASLFAPRNISLPSRHVLAFHSMDTENSHVESPLHSTNGWHGNGPPSTIPPQQTNLDEVAYKVVLSSYVKNLWHSSPSWCRGSALLRASKKWPLHSTPVR